MKSCLAFLTSALSTIPSNLQKVDESHLKKDDEERKFRSDSENTALNVGPEKAGSDPASKSSESNRKRKEEENLKYSHSCHFRTQSGNILQRLLGEVFKSLINIRSCAL